MWISHAQNSQYELQYISALLPYLCLSLFIIRNIWTENSRKLLEASHFSLVYQECVSSPHTPTALKHHNISLIRERMGCLHWLGKCWLLLKDCCFSPGLCSVLCSRLSSGLYWFSSRCSCMSSPTRRGPAALRQL